MKKVYISKTGTVYAFPVKIKKDDKTITSFIQFGNDLKFETSNADVQKGVEESRYFKNKQIALLSSTENKEKAKEPDGEPTSYPEVIDINDAVEILKKAPYKIHHQSLKTPENIAKHATACNVVFPNLKL